MLFAKKQAPEKPLPQGFEVKRITDEADIEAAFRLAEEVFMRFEAPTFPEKGVKSFLDFLWGKRVRDMLADGSYAVWVCLKESVPAGVFAMRDGGHISLAFVRPELQRMGIGRALYSEVKKYALKNGKRKITVNAGDCGIPFYKAMGFKETDMRLMTDGIVYTPMEAKI